jgi:hypothetical protein
MGEVMGQSGQVFCSGYIVYTIFWNPQRMSLNMQGVWPSPIMLPIMLKGHDFRIITWQSKGIPYPLLIQSIYEKPGTNCKRKNK